MIAEILGTGQKNAKTAKEISLYLGISPREIGKMIQTERRNGCPICATTEPPGCGYFLAKDKEEMRVFCGSLYRRAGEIFKTRRACLKTIHKLPGREAI